MVSVISISSVLLGVILAWAFLRWRARRFEEEMYSISGGLTNQLSWIVSQSPSVQRRMRRLYILSGYLACRVNTLESARSTYLTDRSLASLEATLEQVDLDSYQPGEHFLKSRENLEECSRLVLNAAQTLLHQLAVEKTRRTGQLISDQESRRIFRQELDAMGSVMFNARVLAEDVEKLLSTPLEVEYEAYPQREKT